MIYHCIREAGRWEDGRWIVHHSQACGHQHRTIEAARACLRWPGVRITCGEYAEGEWGKVLRGEEVVEHVLPARFVEQTESCGDVVATLRSWRWERPDPRYPKHRFELDIVCGGWEASFIGKDAHQLQPEAWAAAVHCLLLLRSPAEVVAALQDMRRIEREDPDLPDNVVTLSNWRKKC